MDIDEYAKNCHQDIVVDKAVPEYNRSTAELLCSRVVGLLERVAELEGERDTVVELASRLEVDIESLNQTDTELTAKVAELQARLDRANRKKDRLEVRDRQVRVHIRVRDARITETGRKNRELQAQLERANAIIHELSDLLELNAKDSPGVLEVFERASSHLQGQGNPQLNRATEPRADTNARQTWAELQRLRRVLLSFGRRHLSMDKFYGPEGVLTEAWQELGRLRNRDRTLERIATALGMEYASDNTISDNRDLRVYRAVMELKEGKSQEPRPMSEAPRDGTDVLGQMRNGERRICCWAWSVSMWVPSEPLGWWPRAEMAKQAKAACSGLPTSSGGEGLNG